MGRAAPALLAMLAVAAPAVAQPAPEGQPPTTGQIVRACQADFAKWCGAQITGQAADRACLRQYWSALRLDCRIMLRRQAATVDTQ